MVTPPIGKIIAKDDLNIANLMQNFFSKTAQENSELFYPSSPWIQVI